MFWLSNASLRAQKVRSQAKVEIDGYQRFSSYNLAFSIINEDLCIEHKQGIGLSREKQAYAYDFCINTLNFLPELSKKIHLSRQINQDQVHIFT